MSLLEPTRTLSSEHTTRAHMLTLGVLRAGLGVLAVPSGCSLPGNNGWLCAPAAQHALLRKTPWAGTHADEVGPVAAH